MASKKPAGSNQAPTSSQSLLARYEPVIGLEVHCQLNTQSKLFCGCSTSFGALANHHTCPVCLGLPGALPVINKSAVDLALKLALAVGADIHQESIFARKQYFYPDLPKGYQISQYDRPYCTGGGLRLSDGSWVALTRIHIEEDAGKSVHEGSASFVDLNRAGVALVEIVTDPVLSTPGQAHEYLKRLRSLVRHIGVSDGNLEEGSFRCDANVSIRPRGQKALGTRCEIKNLNSFRNIEKAIGYEIARQADLLDHGEAVVQETRLYDPAKGRTRTMRVKEESEDYRYFPDPDLPRLQVSPERIASIQSTLPELPDAMSARFEVDYGLSPSDASYLASDRDLARYFEKVCELNQDLVTPKITSNWITTELTRFLNEQDTGIAECAITPERLSGLLRLLGQDTISGKIAKKVFRVMTDSDQSAQEIVTERGWVQVVDPEAAEKVVSEVLRQFPDQVQEFLAGKEKVFGFLVGQAMKASAGKLNPDLVNRLLKEEIEKLR